MGKLRVMNHTGDHEVEWGPEGHEKAEKIFKDKIGSHVAFVPPGNRVIKAFEPEADEIVMRPPYSGG
jgi:hypothetical protein